MDDDVLGAPKAWQIKEFPEGLRNRIIAAARDADQSVAEYVDWGNGAPSRRHGSGAGYAGKQVCKPGKPQRLEPIGTVRRPWSAPWPFGSVRP
jgi:hypothetical protein